MSGTWLTVIQSNFISIRERSKVPIHFVSPTTEGRFIEVAIHAWIHSILLLEQNIPFQFPSTI